LKQQIKLIIKALNQQNFFKLPAVHWNQVLLCYPIKNKVL